MTRASSALVLVTPVPNRAGANFSVVPRSFGRYSVTGPEVVLIVTGQYPLRVPSRAVWLLVPAPTGPGPGMR